MWQGTRAWKKAARAGTATAKEVTIRSTSVTHKVVGPSVRCATSQMRLLVNTLNE